MHAGARAQRVDRPPVAGPRVPVVAAVAVRPRRGAVAAAPAQARGGDRPQPAACPAAHRRGVAAAGGVGGQQRQRPRRRGADAGRGWPLGRRPADWRPAAQISTRRRFLGALPPAPAAAGPACLRAPATAAGLESCAAFRLGLLDELGPGRCMHVVMRSPQPPRTSVLVLVLVYRLSLHHATVVRAVPPGSFACPLVCPLPSPLLLLDRISCEHSSGCN